MKQDVTIAVSILTADFLNLKSELDRIIQAKIPAIHFDVMDYHFVPNLSFGPKILSDVCNYIKTQEIVVDCHLMVTIEQTMNISDYLEPFIIKGVNTITLHLEALTSKQLNDFINLKDNRFKKGLAINPGTVVRMIEKYLSQLDLILLMSVNPGFGKQSFIDSTYNKIAELKQLVDKHDLSEKITIAVDGGINNLTANLCLQAGANYLVSGSYLLNNTNSLEDQMKQMLQHD